MLRFVTVSSFLLLLAAVAWAEPSRRELELELRAVRAEKERYLAEMSYGQRLVEEAQKALPEKFLRERQLIDELKRLEDKKE